VKIILEGGKIGQKQLRWLVCVLLISTILIYLPRYIAKYAKQDSWITVIAITVISLVVTLVIIKLGLRFPNQTINSYSQLIVGSFLGKLISVSYLLFFIHISALIIMEIAIFLTAVFITNTPVLLIILLINFVAALAVRNGIEVISRVNEFVYPLVIFAIMLIFLLIWPELKLTNFQPVLEHGWTGVGQASSIALLFFSETIVLVIILPTLASKQGTVWSISRALLIVGVLTLLVFIMIIGLFGASESAELTYPTLSAVRYISIFGFVERIDALVIAGWIGGGFIKLSIFYYSAAITTAELFELDTYRPVVFPLGLVISFLAPLLFANVAEMEKLLVDYLPPYYLSMEILLPSLLLIIAKIRGVRGTKICAEK
jgi:spore germination protein KB